MWHGCNIQDGWVNNVTWPVCHISFYYMAVQGRLFKRCWPSFHPFGAKLCILAKQHCVQVDVDKGMTPALTTDLPKAVCSTAGAPGHPQRSEQRLWSPLCVCPIHSERLRDEEFMSFEFWLPYCEFHIVVDTDITDEEIVFD